jgi:hypothetical protein
VSAPGRKYAQFARLQAVACLRPRSRSYLGSIRALPASLAYSAFAGRPRPYLRPGALRFAALLLSLAALAAGCGGSNEEDASPPPTVLPRAVAVEEWALRLVEQLIRPTNQDIETLTTLNNPQTKLFIVQGNETTLEVIRERMNDLAKCSDRLITIGPPPAGETRLPQLRRIDSALHTACTHYVKVAEAVKLAVTLMSSGRSDVIARGERQLAEAVPDATAAAKAYDRAVDLAVKIPEFRFVGLKPAG